MYCFKMDNRHYIYWQYVPNVQRNVSICAHHRLPEKSQRNMRLFLFDIDGRFVVYILFSKRFRSVTNFGSKQKKAALTELLLIYIILPTSASSTTRETSASETSAKSPSETTTRASAKTATSAST